MANKSNALTYGTTGNDRTPEATNVGAAFWNSLIERQVTWATDTVKNYAMDVLTPGWSILRNIGQWAAGAVGPSKFRWDDGRLKHTWKAIAWTAVDLTRGLYNLTIGWAAGALDNLYRKNVSDAVSELLWGTVDRLGKPWRTIGNLLRLWVMIPGMVPRTLNMVAKTIDKPLNWAHEATRLSGQDAYTPNLRWPSISALN